MPLQSLLAALALLTPGIVLSTDGDVRVLAVDPALLRVVPAQDRLERPSAMAARVGAVAGVNGGFFAVGAPDVGDPTGIVVADGQVLSEPVGTRTALLVDRRGTARVAAVRWRGRLTAGGATRLVDGVNRNRGRIPACGGTGGDHPTQHIDTARTCTDPSELVVLTPAFGRRSPRGGTEVALRDGIVTAVRRGGTGRIPRDGHLLTGSGDAARFLRRHLAVGDAPRLRLGHADQALVLGGAPRLLRAGRVLITARREGRGADTGRVPRTLVGVRADGTVLLTTTGPMTLREAARTARAHGARDALGLDSGSSTTMLHRGRRLTRGPERPVANGLFAVTGGG